MELVKEEGMSTHRWFLEAILVTSLAGTTAVLIF